MAAYHTPITLTRTPQAVGPFTDKVTIQPQGGDIFFTDLSSAAAGMVGILVPEGAYFHLPVGQVIQVWHAGRAGTVLVMIKALE